MDDAHTDPIANLISIRVEEDDARAYAEFTQKLLGANRKNVNHLIASYFAETFDNWAHYFVMTLVSHDNLAEFEAALRARADVIVMKLQTQFVRLPKLDSVSVVAPILELQLAGRISYWKAEGLKRLRTNKLKKAAPSLSTVVAKFEASEAYEVDEDPAGQSIPPATQTGPVPVERVVGVAIAAQPESTDDAPLTPSNLWKGYQTAFPEKIMVLDVCWASRQRYREWTRWIHGKLKDTSKPAKAFRAILTSGKRPTDYRPEERPKGWK